MPLKLDASRDPEQYRVADELAAVLDCSPEQVPRGKLSYAVARNGKGGSTSERKSGGGAWTLKTQLNIRSVYQFVSPALPQRWQQCGAGW